MARDELIAACWTSAGACTPMSMVNDDRSPVPIRERVQAVAEAGFMGFGIRRSDLMDVKAHLGYPAFRALLDEFGIKHLELEFLEGWHLPAGEARSVSDQHRAQLLEASGELGARHIKLGGDFTPIPWNAQRMGEELGVLAEQAAATGARVGLEPMPFADVQTPEMALEAVEIASHPAAGLCLDVWHIYRAGLPVDSVASIPVDRIVSVELDDAVEEVVGTMLEDTFNGRRFPGEGDIDLPAFVRAIKSTGFSGPWGVEMLSTDFRKLPVQEATRLAFETSMRYLDGVGD